MQKYCQFIRFAKCSFLLALLLGARGVLEAHAQHASQRISTSSYDDNFGSISRLHMAGTQDSLILLIRPLPPTGPMGGKLTGQQSLRLATNRLVQPSPEIREDGLRLYLDCEAKICDLDFLRSEIAFVDYTRDRQDAQVHLLITAQPTGAGGMAYTLDFIGQQAFRGEDQTLRHTTRQTDTEDIARRGLVRTIELGLMRYVSQTSLAEHIDISYHAPQQQAESLATLTRDPWNYWTFEAGLSAYASGEKYSRFRNFTASLEANRTTEGSKFNVSVTTTRNESAYDIGESDFFTNIQRDYTTNVLWVGSLGGHWSAGGRASAGTSTFRNHDLSVRIAPAVEYSLFPYSESTRRQFTFQYSTGVNMFDYIEETIFHRMSDQLVDQRLAILLSVKQPWGSISATLEGSHYFHDFSMNQLVFSNDISVRLFKGLALNVEGDVKMIRDQLSIPKRGASPEEILLHQRELATSYWYSISVGFSYTIGSIYNDVVNPRLR